MNNIFHSVVEIIYWVMIFLSPVLLFGGGGLLVFIYYNEIVWLNVLLFCGVAMGGGLAEFVRRKYGCTKFMSQILATPDIWPIDDNKKNEDEK